MAKQQSKYVWFVKLRGSYIPCAWQGWVLYIPFIFFLVVTMVEAFRGDRSNAGIVYFIFPQYVAATVSMHWIASRLVDTKK